MPHSKEVSDQIMLCPHVDDTFVTTSSEDTLIKFRNRMLRQYGDRFDVTAETDAKEYLGMEWERDFEQGPSKLTNRRSPRSF